MAASKVRSWFLSLTILLAAAYLLSGIYSLQSGQNALVLRFGRVTGEVAEAGIHYHLPLPVERVVKVRVSEVKTISIQEQSEYRLERVTGDANLILVDALISYNVKRITGYLYNIQDVQAIIKVAGQKCLSAELAEMNVDDVMTTGKSRLRLQIKNRVQAILDSLATGVRVLSVELTDISPPRSVSSAFKAVSDARVKKQEIIREADGYANSVIPKARGKASSLVLEARAYEKEILSSANGRVTAFNDLVKQYHRNPEVTSKQKHLETMQKIFSKSQVNIDTDPAQSIYYIERKKGTAPGSP
ncbi:MAG: FtsH protease activity modulator HflK [Gemmatimonadota bacterium]|nr:FtsH protease activity modulator HflK [Gemmatimonadota bacterium]